MPNDGLNRPLHIGDEVAYKMGRKYYVGIIVSMTDLRVRLAYPYFIRDIRFPLYEQGHFKLHMKLSTIRPFGLIQLPQGEINKLKIQTGRWIPQNIKVTPQMEVDYDRAVNFIRTQLVGRLKIKIPEEYK